MAEIILDIKKLNKSFGPTHANVDIDFQLEAGEVRGLAGENGSGKSTLLSQIAGMYPYDSGEMTLHGKPYKPTSPVSANESKVAIIVQELGMVSNLPAGINIFLGKTKKCSHFGLVNNKMIKAQVEEITKKWELSSIDLNVSAGYMNIEHRKMVELVRALSADPDILILDEVTQSLSQDNRKCLYKLIRKFKEQGRSIILISHDIEEMIEITDTISILRDGALLDTVKSKDITSDELKQRMVGRKLDGDYYRDDHGPSYEDDVLLEVGEMCTENGLEDISFKLHKGQILGFCGLSDSGIHEIGKAVYGIDKLTKGRVHLNTCNIDIKNQEDSLYNRVGYAPKDRDTDALMMDAPIWENFTLPSLKEAEGKSKRLNMSWLNHLALDATKEYQVKCRDVYQNMRELSGGNKQKVNLGRWLLKDLDILIVDCPTRGVDVGVKAYLYDCLKKAKAKNLGIIMITDELGEAIGMCDDIIVMKDNKIVKSIERGPEFKEEIIIEVMI